MSQSFTDKRPVSAVSDVFEKKLDSSVDDCPICIKYAGKMAPSHNGSRYCKSGSIASGGTRAHCTCDTCF